MKTGKVLLLAVLLVSVASCAKPPEPEPPSPTAMPLSNRVALTEMATPAGNPDTPEKAGLGKQLFFDTRLSKTGSMSCETCHLPEKGWTDAKPLSTKFDGSVNVRHTPTLINVGYYKEWYWDGRAATLEGQISAAWKGQMGADPEQIAMALNGIEGYKKQFEKVMGGPATPDRITQALASFVRTITSDNSPWDRYEKGDKSAVSEDAVKGFAMFSETDKANCTLCHLPPEFTDLRYHNVGIGFDKEKPDMGRGKILADALEKEKKPVDKDTKALMGAFKTPTMRSITETGPYFHDGRAETLEEAVDYILSGGIRTNNPTIDPKLKKKTLKPEEKAQLMAFLKSLTPESQPFERPKLP